MDKIKKIVEKIVKNGENTLGAKVSGAQKAIDENTINNLILNILIKNKYLEKLNAPIDGAFEDFAENITDESRANEIRSQVKKLVDFGLISGEMGEKILEKFGVNNTQNVPQTQAEFDFLENNDVLCDFFKKRNSLYDYIKNAGQTFEKDELEKIANVVKSLEEQAKAEYMQELYNNKLK